MVLRLGNVHNINVRRHRLDASDPHKSSSSGSQSANSPQLTNNLQSVNSSQCKNDTQNRSINEPSPTGKSSVPITPALVNNGRVPLASELVPSIMPRPCSAIESTIITQSQLTMYAHADMSRLPLSYLASIVNCRSMNTASEILTASTSLRQIVAQPSSCDNDATGSSLAASHISLGQHIPNDALDNSSYKLKDLLQRRVAHDKQSPLAVTQDTTDQVTHPMNPSGARVSKKPTVSPQLLRLLVSKRQILHQSQTQANQLANHQPQQSSSNLLSHVNHTIVPIDKESHQPKNLCSVATKANHLYQHVQNQFSGLSTLLQKRNHDTANQTQMLANCSQQGLKRQHTETNSENAPCHKRPLYESRPQNENVNHSSNGVDHVRALLQAGGNTVKQKVANPTRLPLVQSTEIDIEKGFVGSRIQELARILREGIDPKLEEKALYRGTLGRMLCFTCKRCIVSKNAQHVNHLCMSFHIKSGLDAYQCDLCSKQFYITEMFVDHRRKHRSKGPKSATHTRPGDVGTGRETQLSRDLPVRLNHNLQNEPRNNCSFPRTSTVEQCYTEIGSNRHGNQENIHSNVQPCIPLTLHQNTPSSPQIRSLLLYSKIVTDLIGQKQRGTGQIGSCHSSPALRPATMETPATPADMMRSVSVHPPTVECSSLHAAQQGSTINQHIRHPNVFASPSFEPVLEPTVHSALYQSSHSTEREANTPLIEQPMMASTIAQQYQYSHSVIKSEYPESDQLLTSSRSPVPGFSSGIESQNIITICPLGNPEKAICNSAGSQHGIVNDHVTNRDIPTEPTLSARLPTDSNIYMNQTRDEYTLQDITPIRCTPEILSDPLDLSHQSTNLRHSNALVPDESRLQTDVDFSGHLPGRVEYSFSPSATQPVMGADQVCDIHSRHIDTKQGDHDRHTVDKSVLSYEQSGVHSDLQYQSATVDNRDVKDEYEQMPQLLKLPVVLDMTVASPMNTNDQHDLGSQISHGIPNEVLYPTIPLDLSTKMNTVETKEENMSSCSSMPLDLSMSRSAYVDSDSHIWDLRINTPHCNENVTCNESETKWREQYSANSSDIIAEIYDTEPPSHTDNERESTYETNSATDIPCQELYTLGQQHGPGLNHFKCIYEDNILNNSREFYTPSQNSYASSDEERHTPSQKSHTPSQELHVHIPDQRTYTPSEELNVHTPSQRPFTPIQELPSPSQKSDTPSQELQTSQKPYTFSQELHEAPHQRPRTSSDEMHAPSQKSDTHNQESAAPQASIKDDDSSLCSSVINRIHPEGDKSIETNASQNSSPANGHQSDGDIASFSDTDLCSSPSSPESIVRDSSIMQADTELVTDAYQPDITDAVSFKVVDTYSDTSSQVSTSSLQSTLPYEQCDEVTTNPSSQEVLSRYSDSTVSCHELADREMPSLSPAPSRIAPPPVGSDTKSPPLGDISCNTSPIVISDDGSDQDSHDKNNYQMDVPGHGINTDMSVPTQMSNTSVMECTNNNMTGSSSVHVCRCRCKKREMYVEISDDESTDESTMEPDVIPWE